MDPWQLKSVGALNVEALKSCRDNVPPVLYRLWTTESSKHVLMNGTERGDVNTIDRMGTRAYLEGFQLDSIFDIGDRLGEFLGCRLDGRPSASSFTSWTHSLLAVLARAKESTRAEDPGQIHISIMITGCFENKEIYHVPDIYRVGYSRKVPTDKGYPHDFLVHGPVSGPGLATIPLPLLINALGLVWKDLPHWNTWFECHRVASLFCSQTFPLPVDHANTEARFELCAKAVQSLVLPQFQRQQLDAGSLKFVELYMTAQLYCMRKAFWSPPEPYILDAKWVTTMTNQSSGELSEQQRDWCYGIIPKIHAAIEPQRTKAAEHFPDVKQTLYLLGNFGKTLMDFGRTFRARESGEAGDLAELSSDHLLEYLGLILAWDRKRSGQVGFWLCYGWQDSDDDYWAPFRAFQG